MDGHVCRNSKRRLPFISKHRLPFFVCRPRKTNFPFPFAENKQKFVCHFHFPFAANKRKLLFSISSVSCIYIYTSTYIYIFLYVNFICCRLKRKMEAQAIFPYIFIVCSSCKWLKFVVCPFVYEETNGSYSLANRVNRLNGLAHLCK